MLIWTTSGVYKLAEMMGYAFLPTEQVNVRQAIWHSSVSSYSVMLVIIDQETLHQMAEWKKTSNNASFKNLCINVSELFFKETMFKKWDLVKMIT